MDRLGHKVVITNTFELPGEILDAKKIGAQFSGLEVSVWFTYKKKAKKYQILKMEEGLEVGQFRVAFMHRNEHWGVFELPEDDKFDLSKLNRV